MSSSNLDPDEKLFLKLALRNGLLSRPQLQMLVRQASRFQQSTLSIAEAHGFLDREQIQRIHRAVFATRVARIDRFYAQVLRSKDWVPVRQIRRALELQHARGYAIRLGEMLVKARILTLEQHSEVLKELLDKLGEQSVLPKLDSGQFYSGSRPDQRGGSDPDAGSESSDDSDQDSSSRRVSGRFRRPPTISGRRKRLTAAPNSARQRVQSTSARAQPLFEVSGDSGSDEASRDGEPGEENGWLRKTTDAGETITPANSETVESEVMHASDEASNDVLTELFSQEIKGPRVDTSEAQRKFVASALELVLEESDAGHAIRQRDRDLVADEVRVAERLSRTGGDLEDTEQLQFRTSDSSLEYSGIRGRRRLILQIQLIGATVIVVVTLILGVGLYRSNQRERAISGIAKQAQELEAKTTLSFAQRQAGYSDLLRELKTVAGSGVERGGVGALAQRLERGIIVNGVFAALKAGRVSSAQQTLERVAASNFEKRKSGVAATRLAVPKPLILELENEIILAGLKPEKVSQGSVQGRAAAVAVELWLRQIFVDYKGPLLASPESLDEALKEIERDLEVLARKLSQDATARESVETLGKMVFELTGRRPETEQKRLEQVWTEAVRAARRADSAGRISRARQFWLLARRFKNTPEIADRLLELDRRERVKSGLKRAQDLIEEKRWIEAIEILRQAKYDSLKQPESLALIDRLINRCVLAPKNK